VKYKFSKITIIIINTYAKTYFLERFRYSNHFIANFLQNVLVKKKLIIHSIFGKDMDKSLRYFWGHRVDVSTDCLQDILFSTVN